MKLPILVKELYGKFWGRVKEFAQKKNFYGVLSFLGIIVLFALVCEGSQRKLLFANIQDQIKADPNLLKKST